MHCSVPLAASHLLPLSSYTTKSFRMLYWGEVQGQKLLSQCKAEMSGAQLYQRREANTEQHAIKLMKRETDTATDTLFPHTSGLLSWFRQHEITLHPPYATLANCQLKVGKECGMKALQSFMQNTSHKSVLLGIQTYLNSTDKEAVCPPCQRACSHYIAVQESFVPVWLPTPHSNLTALAICSSGQCKVKQPPNTGCKRTAFACNGLHGTKVTCNVVAVHLKKQRMHYFRCSAVSPH